MIALIALLKKDLLLFGRDRKNVALVIATPVIIMIILGNVFSGTTKEEFLKNIKIGYCSQDPLFDFVYPFTFLTYPSHCEEKTKEAVMNGKMRAAMYIPPHFKKNIEEGYGSELMIYVDNAKSQTAFAITTAMEAFVNAMNEQIGVSFIQEAWNNLKDLDKKLSFAAEQLEGTKQAALLIEKRTRNLSATMDIINITAAYQLTDQAEMTLNESMALLRFSEIENASFPMINFSLTGLNITSTYLALCVSCSECLIPPSLCSELNTSREQLEQTEEELENLQLTLRNQLSNSSSLFEQYRKALVNAQNNASHVQSLMTTLNTSLDGVRTQIASIEEAQTNAKQKLREIEQITSDYTAQTVELQEKLNKTAYFLAVYTKREPRNIVRAVALKKEETFPGGRPFTFMAPGIIIIILMLITFLVASTSLVTERKAGTMMRNILSPLPLSIFLLEKVLFLLLLGMVQIGLMLFVISFFSVIFPFSFSLLGIFIFISLFLITIGLFLGALAKSENTALLSSLVLSIPLMFLSGVFFAFESMPKEMAFIGNYSPTTMAIHLLESVTIYAIKPEYASLEVLGGLVLLFFALTYLLVKRNPTIQ